MQYPSRFIIMRSEDQLKEVFEFMGAEYLNSQEREEALFYELEHPKTGLNFYFGVVDRPKAGYQISKELHKILATTHEPGIIYVSAACCGLIRGIGKLHSFGPLRILQQDDDLNTIMSVEIFDEDQAVQAYLEQQRRYVREHMNHSDTPPKPRNNKKNNKNSARKENTENVKLAKTLIELAAKLTTTE